MSDDDDDKPEDLSIGCVVGAYVALLASVCWFAWRLFGPNPR